MKLPAPQDEITEFDLQAVREEIIRYIRDRITLEIDGKAAEPEPGFLEPVLEQVDALGPEKITRVRQEFRYAAPEGVERLRVGITLFCEITKRHQAIITATWGGKKREFSLVAPVDLELDPDVIDPSLLRATLKSFLRGVLAFLTGLDHLAFVLALLLAVRTTRDAVKVMFAFAAAHSVTLVLGALGVFNLPLTLLEWLIAASILYVAVENCFMKDDRTRWILAAVFGLSHGLALAADVGKSQLAGFNVGVESALLVVALVVVPLVKGREKLVPAGSIVVGLVGLGWVLFGQ